MMGGIVAMLGLCTAFAGQKSKPQSKPEEVLAAGEYSAQVKGIVCSGCGQIIQQTLEKMKGIDKVSVNQDEKTVKFQVRQGQKLKLLDVQRALQDAAGHMGMGADYELRNLKNKTTGPRA